MTTIALPCQEQYPKIMILINYNFSIVLKSVYIHDVLKISFICTTVYSLMS